mmetsp:Transcript_19074/g.57591  ORF Transcript_19074/g.57591 Transcript_19074/m.57591 type:complete len:214 (-) Transcript_19074:1046-1687(-)
MQTLLRLTLSSVGVDKVVEDGAALGELERRLREFAAPKAVKCLAEVGALIRAVCTAKGPNGSELEVGFVDLLLGTRRAIGWREQPLENLAHNLHHRKVHEWSDVLPLFLASSLESGRNELLEELLENGLRLLVAHSLNPHLYKGLPTDVILVQEDHTSSRHSRGRCVAQVRDLKDHPHRCGERNPFVRHKSKNLIVIHNSVHGLNPFGVDIAI